MTKIVNGSAGGLHVAGSPLTTQAAAEAAPGLLRNAIDERIVRIRPMSTPVDQLSRCAGSRHCGAMTVEYYSVDTKQTASAVARAVTDAVATDRGNGLHTYEVEVRDGKLFEPSETVLFPTVNVGTAADPRWLVAYVLDVADNKLVLAPVNTDTADDNPEQHVLPDLAAGTPVVRMGRAAAELDVQTAQFQALPRKASNHCQIFKMQVEQSTLQKIADKETGWTFSDQEEAAVIDMRLGMEKNFLFGSRARIFDSKKNQYVYLTGGIWYQTDNVRHIDVDKMTENDLVELCRAAFTGNNGSKRKILIGGSRFIEALSKIDVQKVVSGRDPFVKWGIQFREIRSNFGTLYVLHSEVFDQCSHEADAFVLDPDFITKYCHIPFSVETLDLRSSGQRNTDAVVLTEASCLALRYPRAHLKIIGA